MKFHMEEHTEMKNSRKDTNWKADIKKKLCYKYKEKKYYNNIQMPQTETLPMEF